MKLQIIIKITNGSLSSVSTVSAESQFYTTHRGDDSDEFIFEAAKEGTCFLIFDDGQFKGGIPSENNELFEIVNLGYYMVALRVVKPINTQPDGSETSETSETAEVNTEVTDTEETHTEMANTEEVQAEEVANTEEESVVNECYLGFDRFGKPDCFDSKDEPEARFLLLQHYS